MKTYLFIYSGSVLLSLGLTSLAIWLGRRFELTDGPDVRKVHTKPIPRIGGGAIYITVMGVMLPTLHWMEAAAGMAGRTQAKMHLLILAATILFLLGLADDIRPLRARLKLFVQLVAAALVYAGGIHIRSIAVGQWSPINLYWLALPMTMLWIVGITNAVNLSDGVDGLASTVSMIACGVVALLAFRNDQVLIGVLMLTLLGALTGFLYFNFHPARIFLGDSGSLFVGFVIAASSLLCFAESQAFVDLALPTVALGIPILDTLFSILRRFVARRPIFAPDRGHFHHRLLLLGLGQPYAVGIIGVSTTLVTGAGLSMLFVDAPIIVAIFAGIFAVLLALFYAVGIIRWHKIVTGLKNRFHVTHEAREEICEFCNLQLQFEQAKSPGAWWQAFCRAADQLNFAWALMSVTDHAGNVETHLWRRPGTSPASARVTVVKVPVQILASRQSMEVEVAVFTNGSVEGAARRASLFGRLLDEYTMPSVEGPVSGALLTIGNGPPRTVQARRVLLSMIKRLDSVDGTSGPSETRTVLGNGRPRTA